MTDRESATLSAEWVLERLGKSWTSRRTARILDVGCWDGTLLNQLPSKWVRHGIELNSGAVTAARAKGLEVFCGRVEEFSSTLESYDLILMMDVLEHLSDPLRMLHHLAAMLAPGGTFFALTGNGEALGARLFRGAWYYFSYPEHVSFFSLESVRRALRIVQLDEVAVRQVRHHSASGLVTGSKILKKLFGKHKQGTAALPTAIDFGGSLKLIGSRVLRRSDHLLIVARKPVESE